MNPWPSNLPKPIWPAWGPGLLESDVDYDVCDDINDECGFDLHMYYAMDKDRAEKGLHQGIGIPASRTVLNAGLFDRLFDRYKACGPYYKKYGGKYFTVILTVLAMRTGAYISEPQMEYARTAYKSAGLFKEGIKQFRKALDDYEVGEPYDFCEMGLHDTMKMKAMLPFLPRSQQSGHHGPRFFEVGKPTSEEERDKMDQDAPLSCDYCGKPELPDGPKLLRCGKCRKVTYCNKECQTAEWKIHKKKCFTPAQQEERAKKNQGQGMYYTMMTPEGIKHVPCMDPIEQTHVSR